MIVRYWQPLREMETLRRQMDHLFDDLVETSGENRAWSPAVELKELGDAFVLRAQLPGVEAKDLDVQVMKDKVTIAGEHRYEQQNQANGYSKSEFRYGKFYRTIGLPVAIQNDKVEADYKDGVLSLTLPKVAEAQNKVVKVNLTASSNAVDAEAPAAETAHS
ncbi:Hsp20/alpha crystallin family protein [Phormidium tenue FACHB-886]|nr:Hsp20/alpha crystallin family protein [Phormidium tenue FACHB-886]